MANTEINHSLNRGNARPSSMGTTGSRSFSREEIRISPQQVMQQEGKVKRYSDRWRKQSLGLAFFPWRISRKDGLRKIEAIELSRNAIYLLFPKGTDLAAGEVYKIMCPLRGFGDDHLFIRKIVAVVKVREVVDRVKARIEVVEGSVLKGTCAEKMK